MARAIYDLRPKRARDQLGEYPPPPLPGDRRLRCFPNATCLDSLAFLVFIKLLILMERGLQGTRASAAEALWLSCSVVYRIILDPGPSPCPCIGWTTGPQGSPHWSVNAPFPEDSVLGWLIIMLGSSRFNQRSEFLITIFVRRWFPNAFLLPRCEFWILAHIYNWQQFSPFKS